MLMLRKEATLDNIINSCPRGGAFRENLPLRDLEFRRWFVVGIQNIKLSERTVISNQGQRRAVDEMCGCGIWL